MWWVAAVLTASIIGALYFLGGDDGPKPDAVALRAQQNVTKTALNTLAQSPEYAKWRAERTAKLEAEVKQEAETARQARRHHVVVFWALAAWALYQFPVCDGTSRCGTWLAQAVMVQAVACTDAPVHAALFTALVAAYLTLAAYPLTVGYFLWAGLVFLKMHLAARNDPVKIMDKARAFEAYENMNYDAIRHETYDNADW